MDPPVATKVETKSEKTDEPQGTPKSYDCGLCDTEVVYKLAQELLPGLASACVDNTTGGIFKNAGSVAVDMRKEMTDYLTQRSETYVAEFLLLENASNIEISEHPYDIIITLIDDFTSSKRNVFSRVSEWVLSDRREDRIDDFVQEMEINGFWLLARRECVASMLLKNVDYKNAFHCNMVCSSEKEVADHRLECKFRPMDCTNEGCTTRYCAVQKEHHEAVCPFMILPCEQKCSDFVMRREMDRHCVTICPMKLVNCAFYTVGCKSSIPRCNVQQHNADELSSHLLYIIRTAHKEAGDEDLKHRVEQIRSLSNTEKLARARDARALTYLIKDVEAKLGTLEVETKPETGESGESPTCEDSNKNEPPTKTVPLSTEQPVEAKDGFDSPNKKEDQSVSQPNNETRPSTERPAITEDDTELPTKEVNPESPRPADSSVKLERNEDKESSSAPMKKEELTDLQEAKEKEQRESPIKSTPEEEKSTRSPRREKVKEESSNTVEEQSMKSPEKETIKEASVSNDEQESKKSPKEEKSKQIISNTEEDTKKSPKKETLNQSSRSDEQDAKKPPQKETPNQSSRGDEQEESSHQRLRMDYRDEESR